MAGRAVVVGAGLAGLTAALDLVAAGVEVTVLEAGDRPGGRVRTVRDRFVAGRHAESGAEWVDTHHHRVRSLLERFGLELEGEGQRWGAVRRRVHVNGEVFDAEAADRNFALTRDVDQFEDAVAEYVGGIADPADPVAHPDASTIDAMSVADILDRLDLGPVARLLVTRNIQGEFACEPHEVSALFVAQQRALSRDAAAAGEVRAHRVVGGLDRLVVGLAAALGDRVRCRTPVTQVRHDPAGGVTVTTLGGTVAVDHVVLACSLAAVRTIDFRPGLPPLLARAVAELRYGTVTKTALQYGERCWAPGYLTTDTILQRVYEPTEDQDGVDGILLSYRGGDGARRWIGTEAERMEQVAEAMAVVHPCVGPVPLGGFSRAWHEHDRFGGSYVVYGPGQVTAFWHVLRQRHGQLWLAGEHVATVTGYMEGAVETGHRVAAAIAAGN